MISVPNPLASSARSRPGHNAVLFDYQDMSYSTLARRAAKVAGALKALNVERGDRVALLGRASLEWAIAFHGIGWLNATVVPLDPTATAQELQSQITNIAPTLIICLDRRSELERINGLRVVEFDEIAHGAPTEEEDWDLERVRLIVCTSGTSGEPKTVALTTSQLLFSAMGSSIRLGHQLDDRWYDCLPLHHIGGISVLYRCAWLGTTVILDPDFDPKRLNEWIDRGSATQVSLVPAMLEKVLRCRDDSPFPASLRVLLVGGNTASQELINRAKDLGAPLSLTWGMTEAASQVSTCFPGLTPPWVGQGPPVPFARVHNQDGALVVDGPIAGSNAFPTADCGFVDVRGNVHVQGRSDQVFISGGKNINPVEIEQSLERHPAVLRASVIGMSDPKWGARPWAVYETVNGLDDNLANELRTWCRTTLSGYKVPDHFLWVENLPKSSLGKVQRQKVLDLITLRQQTQPVQPTNQSLGHGAGTEGLKIDDGVDQSGGGFKVAVGTKNFVRKGYGARPNLLNVQDDAQPLPQPHGTLKVRLGVNQRHSPTFFLEDGGQVTLGGRKHLFEGDMTVLKDPTKKRDPGPVNLEKTNRNLTTKSHLKNPVSDWEKT